MLGAAHACANPLTARFDVTHGIAVAAMLPAVVRFNAPEVESLYDELEPSMPPSWKPCETSPVANSVSAPWA